MKVKYCKCKEPYISKTVIGCYRCNRAIKLKRKLYLLEKIDDIVTELLIERNING